jgi:two-component system sensor histidine kinase PilS (NtrC family)
MMMVVRFATPTEDPVRPSSPQVDNLYLVVLDPRRLIRWMYVGRLSVASSIFVAAFFTWFQTEPSKTLVTTATFVGAILFTGASFVWTEVNRKPLTKGFVYGQLIIDLLVVTAVVHVTTAPPPNAGSQFAALYILVNAAAALMLPIGGALLIAALGIVIYVFDAIIVSGFSTATLLQLLVFSIVAVGTVYISARLQQAGQGRQQLAAELTRVRLREKDILANIKSGIVTVDDAGTLLFANRSASGLVGLDLESLIGSPVLQALRAVAPVLADSLDRAVRDTAGSLRAEGEITRLDRTFPFGVTTTSVADEGDGAPDGAGQTTTTAIFQDISDQKRLEQLNLRAQRLEAVAELSASLAHEIKNPLASIRSAVEQLSARPVATSDERTLGNLIVRESDRLSRLLSEFLDFARVRVTRRDPVDVGAVARAAGALARAHPTGTAGVRFDIDVPAAPLMILGDDDLLHRAVFNLALNAVQASTPNARVRLVAKVASRDQLPRGVPFPHGAVSVQVIDEGPGIPPRVQDRLFEPFTTTKTGGTGLGLAIAHRAIEAHRGVVLVDTNERGTRFTVLLPLAESLDGAKT